MELTHEQVDKAEVMSGAYDEAYDCLKTAVELLRGTDDPTAKEIADGLDDLMIEIDSDREQYDSICNAAYQQEIEEMTRDYWRAVL